MIYLDNAATTQIDPEVLDAMMPYLTDQYGNAGTLYELGRNAKSAIDRARAQVAEFVGAAPEQIIFTSGGTEANNMVFFSLRDFLKKSKKTHIISAYNEHDSVFGAVRALCMKEDFYSTLLLPDSRGVIDPANLHKSILDDTGLVSIMYMNNETGSENDVSEISRICSQKDILFHTDCVQAAGSCVLNAKEIGCDFMSVSSHKIHGPKGVGALFVKDAKYIAPMIYGGSVQEFGLRGGTENVAGIVGFGKACELMSKQIHEIDIHNSVLKQLFYSNLKNELSEYGLEDILHINGDTVVKHGKTINVRFDDVDGETLLVFLDARGVCVSSGSACNSHESTPSRVLLSMGIDPEDARNSIRVSFSKFNTEHEVMEAAEVVALCVRMLHI